MLAAHTVHKHGVTAYELREMAGLSRTRSICDPTHSRHLSDLQKDKLGRFPSLRKGLEFGRQQVTSRDASWRLETRQTQLIDRNRPERKRLFTQAMESVPHEVRSQAAKSVSAE